MEKRNYVCWDTLGTGWLGTVHVGKSVCWDIVGGYRPVLTSKGRTRTNVNHLGATVDFSPNSLLGQLSKLGRYWFCSTEFHRK